LLACLLQRQQEGRRCFYQLLLVCCCVPAVAGCLLLVVASCLIVAAWLLSGRRRLAVARHAWLLPDWAAAGWLGGLASSTALIVASLAQLVARIALHIISSQERRQQLSCPASHIMRKQANRRQKRQSATQERCDGCMRATGGSIGSS
jgi:hypothetical protein